MKKPFWLPLFIAIALSSLAIYRLDGFSEDSLYLIEETLPYSFHSIPTEKVESILQQPFHYLASGRQSFAFESKDGKWVLKVINQSRFTTPVFWHLLPLPSNLQMWIERKSQRRKGRINAFFQSFCLAFKKMRKETATEYIHFSHQQAPKVTIVDPIGYSREIDLSSCWFFIQTKGEPIADVLKREKNHPEKWEKVISSFFQLVIERSRKGIIDDDLNVMGNIGYRNDSAFLIDPGRLFEDRERIEKKGIADELRKSSKFLKSWVSVHQPDLVPFYESAYQKALNSL